MSLPAPIFIAPTFNICADFLSIGLGEKSPDSWYDYPCLSKDFQEFMSATITPSAYLKLYHQPETFEKVFGFISQKFDTLPIFRKDGWIYTQLEAKKLRSPYRPIADAARKMLKSSKEWMERNVQEGRTRDISHFINMAFVFESKLLLSDGGVSRMEELSAASGLTVERLVLNGFYPYFSNRSEALGEIMFLFHHAKLRCLALITVPIEEREEAVTFIRAHGTVYRFDKLCALCGKTGDLLKCPCKRVRYCGAECQHAHWGEHRRSCRGEVFPGTEF
jgi:hypothetical protein